MKRVVFYLMMPMAFVTASMAWVVDEVLRWVERSEDEDDFWC